MSDKLSFLDGYLFRVMVDMLKSEGHEASGFYAYYEARIEQERRALSHYDRMLCDYMLSNFSPDRQVVHAGSGLGTLPAALAIAGYTVAGVELDARRHRAARRLHHALAAVWPRETERYTLVAGEYPTVLDGTTWLTAKTVLIFTNCGATWSNDLTERTISSFLACGDVILDTRLFGIVRNLAEERQALIDRFQARGLIAKPIEQSTANTFYYHLQPRLGPR